MAIAYLLITCWTYKDASQSNLSRNQVYNFSTTTHRVGRVYFGTI